MSLTTILLTVSVACNVWFVFLLMYDRLMETRLFRFFGKLAGIWKSLHAEEKDSSPEARHGTGNHRQEPFQNDGNPDNDYRTEATSCHFG